jgi:hypothetical protein
MDLVLKAAFAFVIGVALMAGLQYGYVWWAGKEVREQGERSAFAMPAVKLPAFRIGTANAAMPAKAPAFRQGPINAVGPKVGPIDTRAGQRAAIQSRAHRTYLQSRAAQNATPAGPTGPRIRFRRR